MELIDSLLCNAQEKLFPWDCSVSIKEAHKVVKVDLALLVLTRVVHHLKARYFEIDCQINDQVCSLQTRDLPG